MRPVYLHGRGLISALGANLPQALQALATGGKGPQRVQLPGGTDWPCYTIDRSSTQADWRSNARQLIGQAADEAGITTLAQTGAPMFLASSSVDIGAIENESAFIGDSYDFVEDVRAALNWSGPIYLISSACTSAMQALLAAARLIATGAADDTVVLGIELPNRFSISGFAAMQLLTPDIPKPLGAERDGIALGEAVAVLHLSSRPARWRICGGSNLVDGRDPTGAIAQTVARMCHQALSNSGLTPSDIGLIKLQAAGSPSNDAIELAGMDKVFAPLPPLVTLKAVLGHTLGASGAAEIALLTACLETDIWPQPDYPPDPDLSSRLSSSKPNALRYVLADILGFGGGHAALILEDTTLRK